MKPDTFHRSRQGAGYSMARWGSVSDALTWAYNKTANMYPIKGPMRNIENKNEIRTFEDDWYGLIMQDKN
jgi:hypothetical protein